VETTREDQRAILDYLTYTTDGELEDIKNTLPMFEFAEIKRGGYGYKSCLRAEGASIYYDGSPGMGIYVQISGSGCRSMENSGGFDWQAFLSIRYLEGVSFTRADGAVDDFTGKITVDFIKAEVEAKNYSSHLRKISESRDTESLNNHWITTKNIFYIGSMQSNTSVKIYDKALQTGQETPWTRFEVTYRNEKAQAFINAIIDNQNLGQVIAATIRDAIDFKEPSSDGNKCRRVTAEWWLEFLGGVERLKLSIAPVKRTIEKLEEWLDHQCAAAMATLTKYHGGDIDWLLKIVNKGRWRMKPRHYQLLGGVAGG